MKIKLVIISAMLLASSLSFASDPEAIFECSVDGGNGVDRVTVSRIATGPQYVGRGRISTSLFLVLPVIASEDIGVYWETDRTFSYGFSVSAKTSDGKALALFLHDEGGKVFKGRLMMLTGGQKEYPLTCAMKVDSFGSSGGI